MIGNERKMLDDVDHRILEAVLQDARISLKTLAQRVSLSAPSVAERLHRLQEYGIIQAFTADINPEKLGYQVQALIRIRPLPGKVHIVQQLIEDTPEFCECDKVTGDDCYVVRLFVPSLNHLDTVLERIVQYAETHTAIVKSQPIRRRPPPFPKS
jgi:Lrp/AsnC family leucine-responsive transcriptional regulator